MIKITKNDISKNKMKEVALKFNSDRNQGKYDVTDIKYYL